MDIFTSDINGIQKIEVLTIDGLLFSYNGQIFDDNHTNVLIKIFEIQLNRKDLDVENSEEWIFTGSIQKLEMYELII